MSNKSENISPAEIFHIIEKIYRLIVKNWKKLVLLGLVGGMLGFIYASISKPEYKATLSFMINENESGLGSSISSLAGLAGLTGSSSGSLSDDKILFMAESRFIIGSTLLTSKVINNKKDLLVNHFIEFNKMIDGFSSDTSLKNFTYFINSNIKDLTYQENKVLDKIIKKIIEDKMIVLTSKKKSGLVAQSAGIIIIEFKTESEEFSKSFIEELYDRLSNYYINRTIQRQLKNYHLIKERADSLKVLVEYREEAGAEFYDKNTNVVKMRTRIYSERIRKDVEILNLMYAEVLKNLEIAKFALENQTPTFQIIDTPSFPLEMKKVSRLKSAILGSFLFGFVTFLYLLLFIQHKK